MTGPVILLGDVGGTNTRLGLATGPGHPPDRILAFRNSAFPSFDQLLNHYLATQDVQHCTQVILALAAPIAGDTIRLTNSPWVIDIAGIRRTVGAHAVHLVNDLAALALSLPHLSPAMLRHVCGPVDPVDPQGRKLVLGMGTGFNAACLLQAGATTVLPAECGHMTLPVESDDGLHLRNCLARGRGRASVERALSGQGLVEIYRWIADTHGQTATDLPAEEIALRAVNAEDPLCVKAAETLLGILATVAGDLALAYLPHGGVYLAGSVARGLSPMMGADFACRLVSKGRQTDLLQSFPVHLITQDTAALIGCAALAHSPGTLMRPSDDPQPFTPVAGPGDLSPQVLLARRRDIK
jgi:glucokinase